MGLIGGLWGEVERVGVFALGIIGVGFGGGIVGALVVAAANDVVVVVDVVAGAAPAVVVVEVVADVAIDWLVMGTGGYMGVRETAAPSVLSVRPGIAATRLVA